MTRCSLCASTVEDTLPIYVLESHYPRGMYIAVCRDCLATEFEAVDYLEDTDISSLDLGPGEWVLFLHPAPEETNRGPAWFLIAIERDRIPSPDALARALAGGAAGSR
jgi:hypothetical protein